MESIAGSDVKELTSKSIAGSDVKENVSEIAEALRRRVPAQRSEKGAAIVVV